MSETKATSQTKAIDSTQVSKPSLPLSAWQNTVGIVMGGFLLLTALLAGLHWAGRWIHLGMGGLILPSAQAWTDYAEIPPLRMMLSSEQLGGLLGVWLAYLCLSVTVLTWGLGHLGTHQTNTPPLRELSCAIAVSIFGLITLTLGMITTWESRDTPVMLTELTLGTAVAPTILGGLALLASGIRSITVSTRKLTQTRHANRARNTKPVSASHQHPKSQTGQISPPTKQHRTTAHPTPNTKQGSVTATRVNSVKPGKKPSVRRIETNPDGKNRKGSTP